jgi:DSF synthase
MRASSHVLNLADPRFAERRAETPQAAANALDRLKLLIPPTPSERQGTVDLGGFEEMEVELDRSEKILWCFFKFAGRPSFTPGILRDIARVQKMLVEKFEWPAAEAPVRYLVWASRMPGVWNLGGDLDLFASLIRQKDRESLLKYAYAVVEEGYRNAVNLDLPIITVSLVQGDALGGGFEAALSSNLIIAERGAKFGLPEILFNLFPGMGAYNFLTRRIAPALAERMMMSGEVYGAEQLHQMGVVDVLAEDGRGVDAFYDYVGRNGRRHAAHRAIYKTRQIANPVRLEDMIEIARLWVDTALGLNETDLKKMSRLVAAQDRRRERLSG